MLLLPFKVLFLIAVFGVWHKTGKAIVAAGIWALASFLINVFASGLSISAGCWAAASFLMALAVFFGLSYLQRSIWMIPGGCRWRFRFGCFFLVAAAFYIGR
jgi:hypothetical protein